MSKIKTKVNRKRRVAHRQTRPCVSDARRLEVRSPVLWLLQMVWLPLNRVLYLRNTLSSWGGGSRVCWGLGWEAEGSRSEFALMCTISVTANGFFASFRHKQRVQQEMVHGIVTVVGVLKRAERKKLHTDQSKCLRVKTTRSRLHSKVKIR